MSRACLERSVLLLLGMTALTMGCEDERAKYRCFTPLHLAARDGDLPEVRRLLEKGLDVHAIDTHGMSPLCWAVQYGQGEVAECLIARGADVNDGSLAYAVAAKHPAMVEFLLSKGARPGGDPLVQAVTDGNVELARVLIDKGADVDAKGVNVIGGEPSISDCGKYGETPLGVACQRGCLEVVNVLLEHKANVNLKSRYYYPLGCAAAAGQKTIVGILLSRGAKVDTKDDDGKTAADLADENGHKDIGDIIRGFDRR